MSLTLPLILSGCAGKSVTLDSKDHQQMLAQDRAVAEQNKTVELTLTAALEQGVQHNLDARVAAMEVLLQDGNVTVAALKALPGVTYNRSYVRRSNNGASSSRSVLSGLESLEPSQSTDKERFTTELSANWNVIDAALALSEASTAQDNTSVASQRYSKVIQNIERDIYAAYWRALAAQNAKPETAKILEAARTQIDNLDAAGEHKLLSATDAGDKVAGLADRMRTLREMQDNLNLSHTELKSMLSIPQGTQLILKEPTSSEIRNYKALLAQDITAQEWAALKSRPEMREEFLQKNIALREVVNEVVRTLPGAEILFNYNKDSNQFLSDGEWTNLTGRVVQNVINILTLPSRYQAAENKVELANARRQALAAAVLAQVHMGRQRLVNTEQAYLDAQRVAKTMQKRSMAVTQKHNKGFASGGEALVARIDGQIDLIRSQLAYAELQDAYAALTNTLGQRVVNGPVLAALEVSR